jgi:streptogramin lyase
MPQPPARSFPRAVLTAIAVPLAIGLFATAAQSAVRLAPARPSPAHFGTPAFTVYTAGQTPGFSSDAQPYGIVNGPDGNVWFTEQTGGVTPPSLGKITPSGGFTEYATGAYGLSEPYAIVAGADGNLWFTDVAAHAIGRMTTSGTVTDFTAGLSADDVPAGLTRASDGSMWFVSNSVGPYVGRVDTTGTITEVAHLHTQTMNADPSIAQDSTGNLWFTMSDHSSHEFAVEVTQSGHVTKHKLPLQFVFNPCCVTQSTQAFAAASDGSVYFANLTYAHARNGEHVVGFVANGTVTTLRNPVPFISSFVAGPGGKLWFAAQDPFFANPKVGYLSREDGGYHSYMMPRATNPISIAYGADGNLWMSGYNGSAGLILEATP